MTRALLLPILLLATASAQVPDEPGLFEDFSDERFRDNVEALQALAAQRIGPVESGWSCDQAVPIPTLDLARGVDPAPIPQAGVANGLAPAPMPNLCREPLAVLPDGVRFRTDPLPLSLDDDLGRQVLREQALERSLQHYRILQRHRDYDQFRQQIGYPEFEPLHIEPLVAPPGQRP